MRRIAVVTGTRAEYGLLKGVLSAIARSRRCRLQLVVTGQHLVPFFGRTVDSIVKDGFPIAARVPLGLERDGPRDIAKAMARGLDGFAGAFSRLKPDILVLLGDRFEILAAACAALPLRIPVAHIHGGESTEGLIDEAVRHAVTKMSHLHFPASEAYRRRIVSMGEDPRRVFNFGAPGLDGLRRCAAIPLRELRRELRLEPDRPFGLVTFHPVTLEDATAREQSAELIEALRRFPEVRWVCTLPNAEAHARDVARNFARFARDSGPRASLHASLGRARYLSLMRHAAVVVGNSSSGLLEAPSFGVPAVDIGDRQRGRLRPDNVVHVDACDAPSIARAVRLALSPRFRSRARAAENPLQGRRTCRRIIHVLERVPLGESLLKKSFRGPR